MNAMCMKIARDNKALRYNLSKYIHIKEYYLVYVVHKNSISLRDSFQSKKFVYLVFRGTRLT